LVGVPRAGNRGLSRLECHAGSMTQTNGWRNADYCYCHAKQNPGRLWRTARAWCLEIGNIAISRLPRHRHGRDARDTLRASYFFALPFFR
ncbi:MAG TPA: hypothetical protein VFC78_10575, partial [Tepidisphaeraceae bacterium]|nr:hypothetical protein [Tepidisphaeraceae bacterium]